MVSVRVLEMFKQHCPRCKSVRIQLGFNEPPLILKLAGIRELFCNNCGFEFKGFAPSTKLSRSKSGEEETTPNRRRAPRHKTRLRVRLAKILKERFGEETQYATEIHGYTLDISKIGLAIILTDVQAGASDFEDSSLGFCAWVELPTGTVKMRVLPVRREQILTGPGKGRLLIGAHIRGISEADRASLNSYIETLQQ
jgi:hypothetical protein